MPVRGTVVAAVVFALQPGASDLGSDGRDLHAQVRPDTSIARPPADTGHIRGLTIEAGRVVRLSLIDAIERALAESDELRAARARLAQAEARVGTARADRLPQITSLLSYTRTWESPFQDFGGAPPGGAPPGTTPPDTLPPDTLPSDTVPVEPPASAPAVVMRAQTAPGTPGSVQPSQPGGFSPFGFGAEHSWFAGILIEQSIFTGGRLGAQIESAERLRDAARADLEVESADVVFQVQQAYYDAAHAEQRIGIALASLDLAEEQVAIARTRFAEGAVAELEVLRAEVERDNLVPQVIDAQDALEEALVRLHELTEIPFEAEIVLTTDICAPGTPPSPPEVLPPPDALDDELLDLPIVRAAEFQARSQAANLRAAEAAFYPEVGLSGTFGWQAFPDGIIPKDWFRNWSATIQVQYPLFLGERRSAELRLARAELAEADAERGRALDTARGEYEEAFNAARRAWSQVQARSATVARAERIYAINRLRYREGIAIQLEALDALLTLQEARTHLVDAFYDYFVAMARAERTLAVEPDELTLPTGTCPAPARPAEVG